MKHPHVPLTLLAVTLLLPALPLQAQSSRKPIVITPPAIKDGSNWSRAPFPAERQMNDVTPPDGEAIDRNLPPNTPATDPAPDPLPEAPIAILQTEPPGSFTDPGLMPTGRVSVGTSLDAGRISPAIRTTSFAARDSLIADIEARISAAQNAIREVRRTRDEMSASGRSQFEAAESAIKDAERELRQSLRTARRAEANEWEAARAKLQADFDAYASSIGQVDIATGMAPAR